MLSRTGEERLMLFAATCHLSIKIYSCIGQPDRQFEICNLQNYKQENHWFTVNEQTIEIKLISKIQKKSGVLVQNLHNTILHSTTIQSTKYCWKDSWGTQWKCG